MVPCHAKFIVLYGEGHREDGYDGRARKFAVAAVRSHVLQGLPLLRNGWNGWSLRPRRRPGREACPPIILAAIVIVIVAAVVTTTAKQFYFMAKEDIIDELNITREQMIRLLNEDLAREYQAIIAYTVYSQVLKGAEFMDIAEELEKHAGEELTHAIKVAKQIDYLGGTPAVAPKQVKMSDNPVDLLRFDLDNERETVAQYRQRIRQAEAMGEFALSEVLREIIVQEQDHEIDLADALGVQVPETPEPAAQPFKDFRRGGHR